MHKGSIDSMPNVKAGSQSKVIMENPYNYNPLSPEVSSGGTVEITGGMSNKYFNSIYKMSAEELSAKGYSIVSKGTGTGGLTTGGEAIKGTSVKIILRKN